MFVWAVKKRGGGQDKGDRLGWPPPASDISGTIMIPRRDFDYLGYIANKSSNLLSNTIDVSNVLYSN